MILLPCWERPGLAGWLVPRHASLSLGLTFMYALTSRVLFLSQWTASGRPGASGPPAARSALTGAEGSARPRRRRMGGRTARGWCCSPRTAPTGSACRVSAAVMPPGSGMYVAVQKPVITANQHQWPKVAESVVGWRNGLIQFSPDWTRHSSSLKINVMLSEVYKVERWRIRKSHNRALSPLLSPPNSLSL